MIKQRSFWMFVFLNFVTCGLYGLYFWYVWNEDVNCICAGDGQEMPNYIVVLLLGLVTCGIYMYYWMYKQGNRLQANAARYGVRIQENGSSFLLWGLLGLITCALSVYYAYYLMIQAVNQIAPGFNRANGYDTLYTGAYGQNPYRQSGYRAEGQPGYAHQREEHGQKEYQQDEYQRKEYRQDEPGEHPYQQQDNVPSGFGRIICISGPEVSRVTAIQDAQTLTLGQDGSVCNHIIMGNAIEAKHCSIMYRRFDNTYLVTDHSVRGTFRGDNGQRLPGEEPVELPAGSVIYLGDRATMYRLG